MPRFKSRRKAADSVVPAARLTRDGEAGIVRLLGSRLLALCFLAGLGALLAHYPPGAVWAGAALAVYAATLWLKPEIWLFTVPALLPILDLSSWTGWFFVREGDFLVLATLAVGYWKIVPQRSARTLPPAAAAIILLLACSYAISAYLGFGRFTAVDANSFASYQSPFNSIRIVLGFASAILLLPLLKRSLGEDDANLRDYFFPGMLLGLGLAALVVLWERLAFPGLMDFASDYRATGSFSDMHVGGAALDGYLMLSLPFAAVYALKGRNPGSIAAASLVFVLGTYAMLVTFSRSTYLAYALALAVVLLAAMRGSGSGRAAGETRILAGAVVVLLLAYVLVRVFATGGYRTLAAALGMFAAAFFAGALDSRNWIGRAVALGAGLASAAMGALMAVSAGSIYLSYSFAFLLLVGGLVLFWLERGREAGTTMALTSFPLLCLGTVLIAWYWGGEPAIPDALLAVAIAICLVGYNNLAARRLWSLSKPNVAAAILVSLVLGLAIPVTGNVFIKSRFAAVSQDFAGRLSHWRDGLAMIDPGWVAGSFGMGLGSFPQTYFWGNSRGEIPGVQVYHSESDNTFLRLGGPSYEIGFGESLRVFQTIEIEPDRTFRLSFDLRSNASNALLVVNICEKWLLYPTACVKDPLQIKVEAGKWKRYEKTVHSDALGRLQWFGKRTVHLSIAAENSRTVVDVDNVALLDESGRNRIKNGDFSEGNTWWFFSSDRHHLPWHAKNMLLHVMFEQGYLGLALLSLVLLYAMRKIAGRAVRGDLIAAASLAALVGFVVVGLFDSLLDVPRLTLLFYLLVFLGLLPETVRRTPGPR